MPRKPENLEEEVQLIIEAGFEQEYFENLYRGDNYFNQKKIAEILKNNLPWVSQKHIKAVFEYYGIEKWTRKDTAKAYAKVKLTAEYAEKHTQALIDNGYSLDELKAMYESGMSKNDIIRKINKRSGKNLLSKDSIKGIWEVYNLPVRSLEEDNDLRMKKVNDSQRRNLANTKAYGNGYSSQELVDLYLSGLNLKEVAEKTGSNSTTISKLVQEAGHEIKRPVRGNKWEETVLIKR